ncbi:hypothetical protein CsatB_021910 [Cannabis sativa]
MAKNNNIAKRWKVLSGENEWEGLLEPLDLDLRQYVIHYGERAQAIADAFIAETKSKNCGLSRYPTEGFFSHVGLDKGKPNSTINVTLTNMRSLLFSMLLMEISTMVGLIRFLKNHYLRYPRLRPLTALATLLLLRMRVRLLWEGETSLWFGGVAWCQRIGLLIWKDILGATNNPKVHKGWYSIYTATNSSKFNRTSARDQVFSEVKRLMAKYQEEELSITVTGHSMGAALATLNAVDMAYNKINIFSTQPNKAPVPITAFVFASPRVGDRGFGSVYSDLNTSGNFHILRVNEFLDIVPQYPFIFQGYVDVGQLLLLMVLKSPYIKPFLHLVATRKWLPVHNLELHLHGVAGTQGVFGGFNLQIDRDLGLMNKGGDFVKDEYLKITSWWTEKNKSMIQNDDGTWELMNSQE